MNIIYRSVTSPRFTGLTLVGITAASIACAEANWPHWRGPHANGIVDSGNPPIEWNESKNIRWKKEIPGKGHATPIIWGDKLFVATVVGEPEAQGTPENGGRPQGGRGGFQGRPQGAPEGRPEGFQRRPQGGPTERGQLRGGPQGRPGDGPGGRGRGGRGRGGRGGRGGAGAPTTEHTFTTLCLDRNTGAVLWEVVGRKEVPFQGVQRTNTYGSASPVTDGERLFVSFGSHGLYCYDLNGKPLWDKDLGKVSVTFGEGSSPTLHDDTVIVLQDNNGDSFIYALDKQTGKERWKKSRDEGSGWTTPYILERDGKTQVLVSGSRAVRSYDIESGELLWQCSGLGSNPVPMIVADQDTIYAMSGHRQPYAMAVKLGGSGDLTDSAVKWSKTRGTPYVPSPLLYDGLLFYCQRTDAILTCVDAATGTAHFDQERLTGVSGVYASPVGIQDRIYLPSQNGATVVFKKAKNLEVLAVNKLEDEFDASPAIVGDDLYLRGHRHLYCIAE